MVEIRNCSTDLLSEFEQRVVLWRNEHVELWSHFHVIHSQWYLLYHRSDSRPSKQVQTRRIR
jgi:hypothetical protein